MDGKACCFIGHRKIEKSGGLVERTREVIKDLIKNKGVEIFLFGSRSEFDDLCHEIVTDLQKENPRIKRIMYYCRSEYAVKKEEKEQMEKRLREVLRDNVKMKDYDGAITSDRLWLAGKAAYAERNQDMINASEYCVFYYNPQYKPPKRKFVKSSAGEYQPKSGTKIAFDYACVRKRAGHLCAIINVWTSQPINK